MKQELINRFWHWPQALAANVWYGWPSQGLKVIGVTGTSGKTTTAHLLYHLLRCAGFKAALISSIGATIGRRQLDTGLHVTNPDSWELQRLLRVMKNKGYQYVVLEVTSHGLDQNRCWGINFAYGVLTNITHEHLDYHKTMAQYQAAKLKLIRRSTIAVLNQADPAFAPALKAAPGKVIEYRADQAVLLPKSLPGEFNRANVAAAQAVAKDLGLSAGEIKDYLKTFAGLPGRMELVQEKPFKIVIDFAHKIDALEKALVALNEIKSQGARTIAVFGCAGLRDYLKRPIMGAVSARLAETTILTAEDPRTEDVNDIIEAIAQGWQQEKKPASHQLIKEPDRQKAINLAINLARPGDAVGLFGKSHEKSMCFGKIEYPWSEHQAVLKALKLKKEGK